MPTNAAHSTSLHRGLLGLGSRVARRLLLWTCVVGTIGTLLVSGLEVMYAYHQRLAYLENYLRSIGEYTMPALAKSAWAFDREQIDLQLQGFVRLPEVTAARLNLKGAEEMRLGKTSLPGQAIEHSIPVIYVEAGQQRNLGTLTLLKDLAEERAGMWRQGLINFLGNGLVIISIIAVCLLIYQAIVTRRLVAIADELRSVTANDLRKAPPAPHKHVARPDELDDLAMSINALKETGGNALRESDRRYTLLHSLMVTIPDLVWVKDPDGST
ncbi:MAG: hypothetical protein AB1443_07510 [Pseudomonadota bacterium]